MSPPGARELDRRGLQRFVHGLRSGLRLGFCGFGCFLMFWHNLDQLADV